MSNLIKVDFKKEHKRRNKAPSKYSGTMLVSLGIIVVVCSLYVLLRGAL